MVTTPAPAAAANAAAAVIPPSDYGFMYNKALAHNAKFASPAASYAGPAPPGEVRRGTRTAVTEAAAVAFDLMATQPLEELLEAARMFQIDTAGFTAEPQLDDELADTCTAVNPRARRRTWCWQLYTACSTAEGCIALCMISG
jgi:hypothetical protein